LYVPSSESTSPMPNIAGHPQGVPVRFDAWHCLHWIQAEPAKRRAVRSLFQSACGLLRPHPTSHRINPVSSRDNPVSVWTNPASSRSNPASSRSNPVSVWDNPVSVWSNPASSRSNPVSIWSNPVSYRDNPVSVWTNPVSVRTNPATCRVHSGRPIALYHDIVQFQATSLGFSANKIAKRCATENSKLKTQNSKLRTRPPRPVTAASLRRSILWTRLSATT
jgi:hypothetical protein